MQELAEAANLFYYRIRTERPPKGKAVPGFEVFDDQPFQKVSCALNSVYMVCVFVEIQVCDAMN